MLNCAFALEFAKWMSEKGEPIASAAGTHVAKFYTGPQELGEMRYLHETPVLLDDAKLRALLPGLHKTGYEEGARLTMAG